MRSFLRTAVVVAIAMVLGASSARAAVHLLDPEITVRLSASDEALLQSTAEAFGYTDPNKFAADCLQNEIQSLNALLDLTVANTGPARATTFRANFVQEASDATIPITLHLTAGNYALLQPTAKAFGSADPITFASICLAHRLRTLDALINGNSH